MHQFSSVAQLCPTLCDSMNRSSPGLPAYHQLLEFTQTHVHSVRDAIQPSHPLSSPSPPALNLSQHQGLFKWVSSSHQMAKVLEFFSFLYGFSHIMTFWNYKKRRPESWLMLDTAWRILHDHSSSGERSHPLMHYVSLSNCHVTALQGKFMIEAVNLLEKRLKVLRILNLPIL